MDTKTTIVKPEMFEIKKRPSVVGKKNGSYTPKYLTLSCEFRQTT